MVKGKLSKQIYYLILVTIGSACNAVSLHVFVNPLKLVPGGFSGIASILYYVIPNSNMSIIYFVINIPLLIIALVKVRGEFTFKTIWATLVCTLVLGILPVEFEFVAEPLIGAIFGGFMIGLSMYLAHIGHGSNGGTEVIGQIVALKHPERDISHIIMICNLMILTVGSLVMIVSKGQSAMLILYSVLYIVIGGEMMGILHRGFNHPQKLMIVTSNADEISQIIIKKLHRGLTIIPTYDEQGEQREYKVIMVICQYRQCGVVKKVVKEHDQGAFVFIKNIHYVFSRPDFIRSYTYDNK